MKHRILIPLMSLLLVAACGTGSAPDKRGEELERKEKEKEKTPPEKEVFSPRHAELLPALPAVDPTAEEEPPVQVVRGFTCTPSAVGGGAPIGQSVNGESFEIRPVEGEDCKYHVVHTDAAGHVTQLSTQPGGYLFAEQWTSSEGDLAICISNIQHQKVESALHEITAVSLECAFRVGKLWTDLVPVVPAQTTWAPWPRSLALVADGVLALDFARDSTFNVLNMSDNGRPDTDGIYRIEFQLTSSGFDVSAPTALVSKVTNPLETNPEGWTPTEDEKTKMSEYIDFSGGDCKDGCPADE